MSTLERITSILLYLLLNCHCLVGKKVKNFRVSSEITTGWVFCRNQALYTSEFLYEHDKTLFWKFFDDLNRKKNIKQAGKSSRPDQSAMFDILPFNKKASAETFRLLTINLELESFAPKFQAMAQSQSQLQLTEKCSDAFIEYQSGQFACSLDEIEGKDIFGIRPGVFDYKQISSDASSPTIRIYSIAGTDKFNEFFKVLTGKGFNIVVQLLPKPSKCPFYQEEVHPVGYGLEFELKSSQYVVEEPQEEFPDEEELSGGSDRLLKSFSSISAMKSFSKIKQIPKYQLKALNLIKRSKNFDDILKFSTNLPFLTDKLAATRESSPAISTKSSHFRINGLEMKSENFDPFKLVDFINIYSKVSNEIERITKDKLVLKRILKSRTSQTSSQSKTKRYNIQGSSVTFLNNLEKDKRYSDWMKSFNDAQTEDNQFYAKNVLNVIFPIDFGNAESAGLIDSLVQLIQYNYPIRFGIIPILNDGNDSSDDWIKTFYYIRNTFGLRKLMKFIKVGLQAYKDGVSLEIVLDQLNIEIKASDVSNSELEDAKNISKKFALKEGETFANGIIFPIKSNFPEAMMNQYAHELEIIMKNPKAYDDSELYSKLLAGSKTERLSLDLSAKFRYEKDHLMEFESISSLLSIENYLDLSKTSESPILLTFWLAVEYDKKKTFSFLLQTLKSLNQISKLRIFVTNPMISMPNRIVLAASALLSESPNDFDSILKFLENFNENYFGNSSIKSLDDIKGPFSDDKVSRKLLKYAANLDEPIMKTIINENVAFFSVYSLIDYDESLLFSLNGNTLLIPINDSIDTISNNLIDIAEMEIEDRADRYSSIARDNHMTRDILAYSIFERKLLSLIETDLSNFVSPTDQSFPNENSSPIVIGDEDISIFHVEAIFNPFNREGQKFSSIMSYLSTSDSFMFSFNLYLMTKADSDDPKEARIYRFVTPETRGVPIPIVPVDDEETLMAMSIDLPSAWITVTTFSNTDLDNIRPLKVPHLQVSFALNHLTIEGQATISGGNEQVATGKRIQLYNSQTGLLESETSVMANFGYYQVKASSPGLWTLRASSSVQERQETGEDFEYPAISGGQVFLKSFGGKFNRLKISSEGIKASFKLPTPKQADINVFSLASGLFYERLLRIMMTSVMKKKSPESTVKFWLLETTLSAQGVLALEILSKELGFEYELMSYKWPSWLNPQTKKHRTIWAYKILFLDVLFPQSLDRIIFIDADQVVRSDLMELVNLDLEGNVYAMTPFCKDKPDMAPFRFWEHNYWKNHLQGRPYHITALFVVDLLELRKKLVADIIRAQYHMLSQDPNSLANLDQDLPNNLQHHIPIYSLPPEWLWCDSWCSEATKSKAKTIDLCNNPKTFESKFDQAQRIIPEWKDYDSEISGILDRGREEYLKNLKNLKNMNAANDFISDHLEL